MITKPTTLVVVGLVINSNNNLEKTRTKLGQLGQNQDNQDKTRTTRTKLGQNQDKIRTTNRTKLGQSICVCCIVFDNVYVTRKVLENQEKVLENQEKRIFVFIETILCHLQVKTRLSMLLIVFMLLSMIAISKTLDARQIFQETELWGSISKHERVDERFREVLGLQRWSPP